MKTSKEKRLVREYQTSKQTRRAGFMPASYENDSEVETWTVWCKNSETGDDKRATHGDMRSAGFKKAIR